MSSLRNTQLRHKRGDAFERRISAQLDGGMCGSFAVDKTNLHLVVQINEEKKSGNFLWSAALAACLFLIPLRFLFRNKPHPPLPCL